MNYDELDIYSSCMEDLQVLQEEFSSLPSASLSGSNQIRQIIHKLSSKVHREKNQGKKHLGTTENWA